MYCRKCGSEIPDDSVFCQMCGVTVSSEKSKIKRPVWLFPLIGVLIIGVAIAAVLVGNHITKENGKAELHKLLLKDWSRVEVKNESYYELVLDFSEDKIDYEFDSFLINEKIATYNYKVLTGNSIEVERQSGYKQVISISFNDEKTMMTFTPAITSTDSSEYWFNHD